jgi:hypothetical protein
VEKNGTARFFPDPPSASGSEISIVEKQTTEVVLPSLIPPPASEVPQESGAATLPSSLESSEQRTREVRIEQLKAERSELAQRIDKVRRRKKATTTGQWVSYGSGLAALGGMGLSLYLGNQSYQDYQAAVFTDDAVALRKRTQLFQGIAITSGILGGLGIAGGTILLAVNPNLDRLQKRIDRLDAEIDRLEQN